MINIKITTNKIKNVKMLYIVSGIIRAQKVDVETR